MKKHSRLLLISTVLIILFALGTVFYINNNTNTLHESLTINEVESINIWGKTNRTADSDEKQYIVNWFNSITDIRKNKDFAGTTPEAGICIKLKNNSFILVLESGKDFEVQRTDKSGKQVSYWGKQPDIRDILKNN